MPEKNIGEHQVEKPSLRFTLNFLGTMPGYGHEYRLTVESGASAKDLRDVVDKISPTPVPIKSLAGRRKSRIRMRVLPDSSGSSKGGSICLSKANRLVRTAEKKLPPMNPITDKAARTKTSA